MSSQQDMNNQNSLLKILIEQYLQLEINSTDMGSFQAPNKWQHPASDELAAKLCALAE